MAIDKEKIEEALKNIPKDREFKLEFKRQQEIDAKTEFLKSISGYVPIPSLHRISQYVDLVLKSDKVKSIIINGEAGIGKSTFITGYLKEKNCDFEYLNNFATPLAFYNLVYKHKDKVLLLDDIEGLLSDSKGISILKALTDTKSNIVSYHSTSKNLEVPSRFIFKGRVIILTNDMPNTIKLRSLLDRAIIREINLTLDEKIELIKPIIKFNNKDMAEKDIDIVFDFIKSNLNEAISFSFRTIVRIAEFYKNCDNWKQLAKEELKPDTDIMLIQELMMLYPDSIRQQIREFSRRTGKSRMTYYRRKRYIS